MKTIQYTKAVINNERDSADNKIAFDLAILTETDNIQRRIWNTEIHCKVQLFSMNFEYNFK